MHGLINRSIQSFVSDTYGQHVWAEVAVAANLGFEFFEALTNYDDKITSSVISVACAQLVKPRETFLEDLGTYLCTHPNLEPVRRLLRFGGETFVDFLWSLDDLADRAKLAVPELVLPRMTLRENVSGCIILHCANDTPGFGHLMVGVLSAMADDYGTLAVLEYLGVDGDEEIISIQLLKAGYTQGRRFELSPRQV